MYYMEYNVKWDANITCITIFVSISIIASILLVVQYQPEISYWVLFPVFLVVLGVFLYMPYKVGYNNKSIYIRRIKGKVEIPLDSILSINSITPNILQNSVRVFGSGGFLGNIGYFKNEKLGTYVMYTTSTEKLVCIKTTTKTYVINCPDDVLRRVQENKKKDPCSRRNLSKISGCSK